MQLKTIIIMTVMAFAMRACSDLLVKSKTFQIVGQTAVVKLDMRNAFKRKVDSARAAVFVMDPQGKAVVDAVRWVITGPKDCPALPPMSMEPNLGSTIEDRKTVLKSVALKMTVA